MAASSMISSKAAWADILAGEELIQLDSHLRDGGHGMDLPDQSRMPQITNKQILISGILKHLRQSHPLAGTGRLDKELKRGSALAFLKGHDFTIHSSSKLLTRELGGQMKDIPQNTRNATCHRFVFLWLLSTAFREMRTWFSNICVFPPNPYYSGGSACMGEGLVCLDARCREAPAQSLDKLCHCHDGFPPA